MKAAYWKPRQGKQGEEIEALECLLCPRRCVIAEGRTGFCRVRRNVKGELVAVNYGALSSHALDPIEKKPLYHFFPGSAIMSLGTWGCNLACRFCQNWQIAHGEPRVVELSPAAAAAAALELKPQNNIGIAYTYSEPSVWFEFVRDTAPLVRKAGMKNVLVTNGFIEREPLEEILPLIDAMNIDVKAFTEHFYREICGGGRLEDVKRTVENAAARCHVEVTTLIIPGLNDSAAEIAALARWLAGVRRDIPLHFSRYFPNYKLNLPPTPVATLMAAKETAAAFLDYVYIGNVGAADNNTYCPACGALVIDRLYGLSRLTEEKKCPECGAPINIAGTVMFRR